MIRSLLRIPLAGTALAVLLLAGCSLIAPLEKVEDDAANGGAQTSGGRGGNDNRGGNAGNGSGNAHNCSAVFDEATFDEACFQ